MKKIILTVVALSLVMINACTIEEIKGKVFSLEMKVDGALWTAEKYQIGLYTPSSGELILGGQKGEEIINFHRNSVNLNGPFTMPSGNISISYMKGDSLKVYLLSESKPNTNGSVTLKTINESGMPNIKYPEADFSGILFDISNLDSIIITEGKLRYN